MTGGVAVGPRIYGRPDERAAGGGGGDSRSRWLRGHPWRIAVLSVLVVLCTSVVGVALWVVSEASPSGPPGVQVVVSVRSGSGLDQVAGTLEAQQVIGSSLAYRIWSQFHSLPGVLAGSYAFRRNSSFVAVNGILASGPNVFPIQVPAGFTVAELAGRIGQLPGHTTAGFRTAATNGSVHSPWQPAGSTNLDGLLGTGTYVVLPGQTDHQLLVEMVDRFDALAAQVGLAAGAARLGLTPYQVVTVASIVEKEGVIGKNLGPVARVVLNRLGRGMPLQMDSTVLYALGRDGGPVTAADLRTQTPYNTYLHAGLPPTPTCFPSRASLEAALDPPAGSWLYFVVVQSDGTEAFSDTFAGQQANEALAAARSRLSGPDCTVMPPTVAPTPDPGRHAAPGPGRVPDLSAATSVVGVIGDPVSHSLSPLLHNPAFAALGVDWVSVGFPVAAGSAAEALSGARALGIRGLSVTMPHKEAVAVAVDELTPGAARLAAVNCVIAGESGWLGDNTDGAGFVAALVRAHGFDPAGQRCLVVGAGGAARAVVAALADAGAREVVVVNRTPGRAARAAALAGPTGRVGRAEDARSSRLVVNATPAGMGVGGQEPPSWPLDPGLLDASQVVVDLVYHPAETPWLQAARSRGATVSNGLGMLVHQAALQVERWTGRAAPVEEMWQAVQGPGSPRRPGGAPTDG